MSMVALKVNTFKQLKVVEFVAFSSRGRESAIGGSDGQAGRLARGHGFPL